MFAIPDHPWVDGSDGAQVRIAITIAASTQEPATLLKVIEEGDVSEGHGERWIKTERQIGEFLNSDLSIGLHVQGCKPLKELVHYMPWRHFWARLPHFRNRKPDTSPC